MPLIRSRDPVPQEARSPLPASVPDYGPEHLNDADPAVRCAAVRSLGRSGAAVLLADHLPFETDSAVRETILTSLVRWGGEKAVEPLVALLHSEDPALRNGVIETLQSLGDAVLPEIERLLDDPDSDVRIFAVNVLQSLRSERVREIALRVIARDPHVNVCAAATDILAEVGHPASAEPLRALLLRFPDQPFLAFAVRAALQRIG